PGRGHGGRGGRDEASRGRRARDAGGEGCGARGGGSARCSGSRRRGGEPAVFAAAAGVSALLPRGHRGGCRRTELGRRCARGAHEGNGEAGTVAAGAWLCAARAQLWWRHTAAALGQPVRWGGGGRVGGRGTA